MYYDMKPIMSGRLDFDEFIYRPDEKEISDITKFYDDVKFTLPPEVKVTIQNKAGYMTLKMESELNISSHCARCNEPAGLQLTLNATKVISDEIPEEENIEYIYMDEEKQIDITQAFGEQVVFDMPFKILCKDDCKGLCPVCGINLNKGTCDCAGKQVDPRLAILRTLLEN